VDRLAPFESSIAERYHEETKYSEEGLRREAASKPQLDWSAQPVPFHHLEGDRLLLPSEGIPIQRPGVEIESLPSAPEGRVDFERLARVLWFTNGCTRIVRMPGGMHHFRAAPSAGAMYPTEMYVVVRDVPGLDPAAYDYQILDHSLVKVRDGDATEGLRTAVFSHPAVEAADAVVILTGVWRRSSWRYKERGYRRALLDTGHVLGNLVLAAEAEGLAAVPLGCFRDELIENLLAVDPVEEGPLAVVPLVPADVASTLPHVPPRRSALVEWHKAVNRVEDRVPRETPERIIAALQLAGRLDAEAETVSGRAAVARGAPEDALRIDADVGATAWEEDFPITDTIAARRSTRRFAPQPIARDSLLRALAFATGTPPHSLFAPELLRTYVVSLNVVGLPPGSYLYDAPDRALRELGRGQLAAEMLHLGLGQEIFMHAGAVVVHTVDLTRAVQRHGDRVYRLLNLDAGHIGERLNLAALREGLGVSGCGGYYDDEMNRALHIPESQAVVYITSLGTPA
jgi:SagB-type dehydrogenase family enzyme